MSRVLKNELQILREKLMACFRETLPSKQFSALLSLSVIWLGVLVDRDTTTEDEEERRCIKDEFDERKGTIERGIRMLYEQTNRGRNENRGFPAKGSLLSMRFAINP